MASCEGERHEDTIARGVQPRRPAGWNAGVPPGTRREPLNTWCLPLLHLVPMGKASKKKSDRRTGTGPSRAEVESGGGQEQVQRRVPAVLQPGWVGDSLRQVAEQAVAAQRLADDAVTELWGRATPVPAEVPQWED